MPFFYTPPPDVSNMTAILADATPVPETNAPSAGTGSKASRMDHVHQRLTSVSAEATNILDSNGEASITFTRTFDKNPTVLTSEVEPADLPSVTFKVKSYTMGTGATAGKIVGCIIKGKRRRALPQIAQISTGLALLLNLITAINAILLMLNQFLPEVDAAGARFSYIAVASSQP